MCPGTQAGEQAGSTSVSWHGRSHAVLIYPDGTVFCYDLNDLTMLVAEVGQSDLREEFV